MSDAKLPSHAEGKHDAQSRDGAPRAQGADPSWSLQSLIDALALQPHPEGGYYRETYRDEVRVVRESALSEQADATPSVDDSAFRSASTAIYYLLCGDAFSAWHRIRSDEIWHFYAGDALDVHVLRADGSAYVRHRLGNPLQQGGILPRETRADADTHASDDAPVPVFQAVVKAGDWFAAGLPPAKTAAPFALVGCTVAPGFTFSDFEIADPAQLRALHAAYPAHTALIERFTRRPESSPHNVPSHA
ncbi:cupin domain-containing protein [Robbsia sp. KACC 23696]|uniref:cupin domain-containing protein n=1 Tax=Robbsia sp. KACC 23696 TaxID=3149231 RepID=UPI00325B1624